MNSNDTQTGDPSIAVLFNSESGKGEANRTPEEITSYFEKRGKTCRIVEVSGDVDIRGRVEDVLSWPGLTCVVAAGGDGTICAVAGVLSGRGVDLGVLPLGTFNYFARRFAIPDDIEAAVDVICGDRRVTIDLGCVNDRPFLNNASMGLYPEILKMREGIYDRWGRSRFAAYWSVLLTMMTVYRPMRLRITVDGREERAKSPTVFVARSAYQLDEFGFEGADDVRAGKFAIYLAPDCSRFGLLWKAVKVALHGAREGRDFTLLTGEHAQVRTSGRKQLIALDGEREKIEGPFEFSIVKDALTVRVPAASEGVE